MKPRWYIRLQRPALVALACLVLASLPVGAAYLYRRDAQRQVAEAVAGVWVAQLPPEGSGEHLEADLWRLLSVTPAARYAIVLRQGRPLAHTLPGELDEHLLALSRHDRTRLVVAPVRHPRLGPILEAAVPYGADELRVGFAAGALTPTPRSVLGGFAGVAALSFATALLLVALARRRVGSSRSFGGAEDECRVLFGHSAQPLAVVERGAGGLLLVDANEAALRLHGYTRAELVGKPLMLLHPPREHRRVAAELQRVGADGEVRFVAERVRKDGALVPVEVAARLLSPAGPRRLLLADRDLSGERAEQARRQTYEDRLERAAELESIALLASGMAHDMNNTLGVVMASASALQRQVPADAAPAEFVDAIALAAQRGRDLSHQVLGLARPGGPSAAVAHLNDLVREATGLLSRTVGKGVRLELALEPALPWVRGNASQLTHALLNVCINAVDAMAGVGKLSLVTERHAVTAPDGPAPGAYVRLRVKDTGPGMSEETLARITEPFFTTKPRGKGTGLGLTMARQVAERYGGALEVTSALGQGTCVTFLLPEAAAELQAEQRLGEPARDPAAHHKLRGRALLVDDEMLLRWSGQHLLEDLGLEVTAVGSGEEALASLEAAPGTYAVVLLDMLMPGLNGWDTFARLREREPSIPVLITTGYGLDERLADMLRRDHTAMITKPFDGNELYAALASLLTGERAGASGLSGRGAPRGA